jgi:hypothetical protein
MTSDDRPLFHGIDEKEEELAGHVPQGTQQPGMSDAGVPTPVDSIFSTNELDVDRDRATENDPDPMNRVER